MLVYHFINAEHGLANLRHRRLKVSIINELNDPFEFLAVDAVYPEHRRAFRQAKKRLSRAYGMLCFSRKWQNPVQWSHYADRHRGLCLGFDVPDIYLEPISYLSERVIFEPKMLTHSGDIAESYVVKLLTTKFKHWSYENEMRSFIELNNPDKKSGLYFTPFSEDIVLKKVIVGARSSIKRHVLNEALGSIASEVSVFKARLAYHSFNVVRLKNESLWT
ncbi:DUF2971 domain-containing protein [Microvirga alba]|uniref:DUF2971 domain-containing protein n=1 Tax=Microvirga alba TaxID=2791025 RepID=A0A931FPI0_9HYPH|nr:DUF2971 domain-containing protein [Microvirga alba]MBF9235009.1 DUF2971 domain-containing protein [Microvirga alba]